MGTRRFPECREEEISACPLGRKKQTSTASTALLDRGKRQRETLGRIGMTPRIETKNRSKKRGVRSPGNSGDVLERERFLRFETSLVGMGGRNLFSTLF